MKYSWFTMLCSFLTYTNMFHLYRDDYIFFLELFSHWGYQSVLRRVPSALQQVHVDYKFSLCKYVYTNSNLMIYASNTPYQFGNHKFVF